MAIEIATTETLTITSKIRRTWRVEIFAEVSTDPETRVWRETITTFSDGSIRVEKDTAPIIKKGSEIVRSAELAVAHLPATIAMAADLWDKEQLGIE